MLRTTILMNLTEPNIFLHVYKNENDSQSIKT